jgi:predicted metal-binding protein
MAAVIDDLIHHAVSLGASAASAVDPAAIVVEEKLAAFCRNPGCPNYGLSASCPPYVKGPKAFVKFHSLAEGAVVIKLEVPSHVMFGNERQELFQLLHEIVASVEQRAGQLGCSAAYGFAGGCCRGLFCPTEDDCQVLLGQPCRHPDQARPSMSGYGVNVGKLIAAAGWTMERITAQTSPQEVATALAVGLVLVDFP